MLGLPSMNDSTTSDGLPLLTVTTNWPRPDVCVMGLAGELDIATAPELASSLREQTASCPAHLVLDLAEVSLLAAAGVAMIVQALRNDDGVHGRLHLIGVTDNRPVVRVLDMTGLSAVLDVHDNVEELLAHLDRS